MLPATFNHAGDSWETQLLVKTEKATIFICRFQLIVIHVFETQFQKIKSNLTSVFLTQIRRYKPDLKLLLGQTDRRIGCQFASVISEALRVKEGGAGSSLKLGRLDFRTLTPCHSNFLLELV